MRQLLLKKGAAVGFLALLALWAVGFVRGPSQPYPQPTAWPVLAREVQASRLPSANNLKQIGLAQTPLPALLDQPDVDRIRVFEKVAHLATGTAAFDDDEAAVRSALAAHRAAVFNENNSGIAPGRRLTLEVGAPPDQIDALVGRLRQVGRLESVSVQQHDRTGEFRRLHAQRQSLKKYLEAVLKLRAGKKSSVEEELKLEQRIQEVEKELQALEVQFGDLLGKEPYYHVYLTLSEYQPGGALDRTYTVAQRLGGALLWAVAWWCAAAAALGVLAATYLSVRALAARRPVSGGAPAA